MRAPSVAAIENLLHLQVDLLCKPTVKGSPTLPGLRGVRSGKWSLVTNRELVLRLWLALLLLLLLIKTACGWFYSTRWRCCCHFPICTFISMPVDNFHLPPIPPLPPPPPAATPSATSQHVLEPSEPQLLTN